MYLWTGDPEKCPCCGNQKQVKESFCQRCQETEKDVKEAMDRLQRDVWIDEKTGLIIISPHA